jgi:hypothetical protein
MIAMAAGMVVLSATLQTLTHFERRFSTQHSAIASQQDLRIGLRVMEDELRLAGTGAGPTDAAVLKAEERDLVFLANLGGFATVLAEAASPGQMELAVANGSDWPKGKRIVICEGERCVENRLARDGLRKALSLTSPLAQAFSAGSAVSVSNQVRYYLGKDGRGKAVLMRQVDGGANPLIGDIAWVRLRYFDKGGSPTWDAAKLARVRVEVAAGGPGRAVTQEIGLRRP